MPIQSREWLLRLRVWSLDEAASMLRLPPATVRALCAEGRLPHWRGRESDLLWFDPPAVLAFGKREIHRSDNPWGNVVPLSVLTGGVLP